MPLQRKLENEKLGLDTFLVGFPLAKTGGGLPHLNPERYTRNSGTLMDKR